VQAQKATLRMRGALVAVRIRCLSLTPHRRCPIWCSTRSLRNGSFRALWSSFFVSAASRVILFLLAILPLSRDVGVNSPTDRSRAYLAALGGLRVNRRWFPPNAASIEH